MLNVTNKSALYKPEQCQAICWLCSKLERHWCEHQSCWTGDSWSASDDQTHE